MENVKGQGTQAQAVTSLSVPIKMLEMSKFREAEVMTEQYLRTHSDEGFAYLILYAAKVKSAVLHKFKKGNSIGVDYKETFSLYVKHREIFENFLRHGEAMMIADVLRYMKEYLMKAMVALAHTKPSVKTEDIADLLWLVLNAIYSNSKNDFTNLAFAAGKYLLSIGAFEEAKEFFENAKGQGADEAECLLYILYATMGITDEKEFEYCENFSVEMPEYINLLLAIGDNATMLQKVTSLAEKNEKSRIFVVEKREREENERLYQKYTKKGNPALRVWSIVLFWILSAFSLFYFLFLYNDGAVWDLFVHFSPFGREDVTGQIRVSLVTSTVILCLEVLCFLITFVAVLQDTAAPQTIRQYVFFIVSHLLSSFVLWYLMYGYAHWFKNWLGFFNVIVTIPLSLVLAAVLYGLTIWSATNWEEKFLVEKMETLRGKFWVRGYNRNLLATLYIPFGVFMLNATDFSKVEFLDIIALLFLLLGGAYLIVTSLIYRIRAFVTLDNRPELINYKEKQTMTSMETTTGFVCIGAVCILFIFFSATGMAWSIHIGLDITLLLSGAVHIILGAISKNKMQKLADTISVDDE